MKEFLTRHQSIVKGVLSGMDRVRFRGTIRWLAALHGMGSFLGTIRVWLTQFHDWAREITTSLKQGAEQVAEHAGRPAIYVASSSRRKESIAMEIAERDGIREGLICVITCVELCHTFSVGPNAKLKKLELRQVPGKCLHQYFYFLDQQLQTNLSSVFNKLLLKVQPGFRSLFPQPLDYYWSADETEWATDVMFSSPKSLATVYPTLIKHAVTQFDTADVMRFPGRRVGERVHHRFEGDVITTLKTREEDTRVKHALNCNSIKMYDKQGSVLRVETTVNDPRDMKVFRTKENDPDGPKLTQLAA